ncbi:Uncharacterised protein [Vibrio cholerae]|nr:Uncharacterised protein [Vibrio cholerae]
MCYGQWLLLRHQIVTIRVEDNRTFRNRLSCVDDRDISVFINHEQLICC